MYIYNNQKYHRQAMQNQSPMNKEALIKKAVQFSPTQNIKALDRIQQRIKERVELKQHSKSPTDANLIMICLKNNFVFYNLTEGELENIRDKMLWCEVNEGHVIYEEADQTHCFFIVSKGELEETVNGQFKKRIKQADGFGEIAMLYKTKRNSSIKALSKAELWVIDRELFKQAVQEVIIRDFQQNRKCLENLRFFNGLSREHKDLIASSLLTKKFAKNQTIIKEGDPGSCFYYIKDGYASAYKGSKLVKKLMKGDSFGEQSLYYNTMRQLSVKADEESTLLILPRDTLYKIMGEDIYQVTFKNFIRWSLQNNAMFQNLKKAQVDLIIQKMKLSSYKVNETIFRKGVSGFQKLVVVIEGQLKNIRNGAIVASKGQCYGQQFMLQENKSKTMEDQVIMNSYGVLAELTDYKIIEELNLDQSNKKKDNIHKMKNFIVPFKGNKQILAQVKMQDVMFIEQLKTGQFGPILLVKDDADKYIIRGLNKKQLQQFQVEQFIQNEAKILQQLCHPFICSLGKTFHTPQYAYELVEFVEGEDFDKVMEELGLFSSRDGQFYTACILSILQYLYEKSVVSRDIKPENFMVDHQGYLKLINMAVAKKVPKQGKSIGKTYTIIGTPHYMAPDIILGKGYNNMVDIWSLGIMIFEFMCGYLPFGDAADNAYEIYQEIMRNQLKFPEFMVDKRAKKLIQQFLSHNPQSRLDGSFDNIKSNSWFNTIEWEDLQSKNTKPQLIPLKPPRRIVKQSSKHLLPELKRIQKDELTRLGMPVSNEPVAPEKWINFDEYFDK